MPYQKPIIITLIVLVVIAGGLFLLGYKLTPSEIVKKVQQVTNPSDDTETTPTQNQYQTDVKPLDTDKLYGDLFQKLAANKVIFSAIVGIEGAQFRSLYDLYAQDIADAKKFAPNVTSFPIQVALDDLNADGTYEALVYEDLPGFCGTGGCYLEVYRKNAEKWEQVLSLLAYGEVGISTTKTKGYADILVTVQTDDSSVRVDRYAWDGTQYAFVATEAGWTGKKFVPAR